MIIYKKKINFVEKKIYKESICSKISLDSFINLKIPKLKYNNISNNNNNNLKKIKGLFKDDL